MTHHTPLVWILLGKGAGGNAQMIALAEALGWPYETKRIIYNKLNRIPNILLGASAVSVNKHGSDALAPPWPDIVIAGSRRSAPVARWIKKQSGGKVRLVHLMHTQAPLRHFDLILTTPQYRLPEAANVVHNTAPLNPLPMERLATAAERWRDRLAPLPHPWTALLVGGNSSAYILDPSTAARLGHEATAIARAGSGSLLVTTSPRTPADATDALAAAIDCPALVYRWQRNDPDNPYHAFLALADQFIVTADTASQLIEACQTGRPVQVFDWPQRSPRSFWKRILHSWSQDRGDSSSPPTTLMNRLFDRFVYLGLIKPPRDFAALRRALRQRGALRHLAEPTTGEAKPFDDIERSVERIQRLAADTRR